MSLFVVLAAPGSGQGGTSPSIGPPQSGVGTAGGSCNGLQFCASPGVAGLTFDGAHFWVGTWNPLSAMIFEVDPVTCQIVGSLTAPGLYHSGLTWDGSALWCLLEQEALIHRIDPSTGAVLHTIQAPGFGKMDPNSTGIAWDGTHLLVADHDDDMIYRLDPVTGSTVGSFPSPGVYPGGLAFSDDVLLHVDPDSNKVYQLDPTTGTVLDECTSLDQNPWGVTVGPGGHVWHTAVAFGGLLQGDLLPCNRVFYCNPANGSPFNTSRISVGSCDTNASVLVTLIGGPPSQFGYLLIGNGTGKVMNPPGAQGDLCLLGGGCLGRYAKDLGMISPSGTLVTDVSSSNSGGPNFGIPTCGGRIDPGETWFFQYWHRQPMGMPSTFTEAIGVTFE